MAAQIPRKYRAARFNVKDGPLVIEKVDTKLPEQGEILVKVLACGVCAADQMVQSQEMGTPL